MAVDHDAVPLVGKHDLLIVKAHRADLACHRTGLGHGHRARISHSAQDLADKVFGHGHAIDGEGRVGLAGLQVQGISVGIHGDVDAGQVCLNDGGQALEHLRHIGISAGEAAG